MLSADFSSMRFDFGLYLKADAWDYPTLKKNSQCFIHYGGYVIIW